MGAARASGNAGMVLDCASPKRGESLPAKFGWLLVVVQAPWHMLLDALADSAIWGGTLVDSDLKKS